MRRRNFNHERQMVFRFRQFEQALLKPRNGVAMTELEAFIASYLLDASSERPRNSQQIIFAVRDVFGESITPRKVKDAIRALRKLHALPIMARRKKPTGYWWCASTDEMNDFVQLFRAQALDELHTLSRILKTNYPALAGQLNFEEYLETSDLEN